MENITGKAAFLQSGYTALLKQLEPSTPPLWGKMNVQQMVEHMADYVRIGSGRQILPLITGDDLLVKYRAFLETEKPFRENTPNALLPDAPPPVRHDNISDSINELQAELDYLFDAFDKEKNMVVTNPIFGDLGYDLSIQLLYKHASHHLRQFGIDK